MTQFYKISHNSFFTSGFPWIARTVSGKKRDTTPCPTCGTSGWPSIEGDLHVTLEAGVGREWPDILGGTHLLFTVSQRVLDDWKADGIGEFPLGGRILIEPPLPKRLRARNPPVYYWLEGKKMWGASLDEEASGVVGLRYCATCGRGSFDVVATYRRQNSQPWSYVFEEGSWTGANLFTTSTCSSGGSFFCTEKVLACASKHQHTNFRFIPVEEGDAPSSDGVPYM